MNENFTKLLKKIVDIVLDFFIVILAFVLLVVIYNNVQLNVLGNAYSSFFGYSLFEVQTGSMSDYIEAGDWIVVKYDKNIKINDVVTFEYKDEFITHRVVETYNDTFVTKGDANNAKDSPINKSQIVGKVVKILPSFGILKKTLFNPFVLVGLIVIFYLLCSLLKKENKKDDNEFEKLTLGDKLSKKRIDLTPLKERFNFIKIKKIDRTKKTNELNTNPVVEIEEVTECISTDNNEEIPSVEVIEVEDDNIGNIDVQDELDDSLEEFTDTVVEEELTEEVDAVEFDENISMEEDSVVSMDEEVEEIDEVEENINVSDDAELLGMALTNLEEQNNIEVEENKEINNTESNDDIDLTQTVFFRMISVDKSDLERKNAVVSTDVEETVEFEYDDDTEISEEESSKIIDTIQKKKKKCKNFVDKILMLKTEELDELLMILNLGEKYKMNESSIKDNLLNIYLNAKYCNQFAVNDIESSSKNHVVRVEKCILDFAATDLKKYKGKDTKYSEKYEKFVKFMLFINRIEEDNLDIDDLVLKKESYVKRFNKYIKFNDTTLFDLKSIVTKLTQVQRKYGSVLKYIINNADSNMFSLQLSKIGKDKSYFVSMNHNISFNKIYSDYIVDKTYSEGIIAEDKIEVLASLMSLQLSKDLLGKTFDKKYFIYVPSSLIEKERKLEKVLKYFDNSFIKDRLHIVSELGAITDNKTFIKKIMKNGYHFSVDLNNVESIRKKDESSLYLVDYIFINKTKYSKSGILSDYSEDIKSKVIKEDLLAKTKDI